MSAYLDFSRQTKVCDLEELVTGNEDITTGKITMNNVQTGQVLLWGREGEGGREGGEIEQRVRKREGRGREEVGVGMFG